MEECDKKGRSSSDKFRMFKAGSGTFFLEVSAHVSLKVAPNSSFRDKKNHGNLDF